jgi:hypothetical protein
VPHPTITKLSSIGPASRSDDTPPATDSSTSIAKQPEPDNGQPHTSYPNVGAATPPITRLTTRRQHSSPSTGQGFGTHTSVSGENPTLAQGEVINVCAGHTLIAPLFLAVTRRLHNNNLVRLHKNDTATATSCAKPRRYELRPDRAWVLAMFWRSKAVFLRGALNPPRRCRLVIGHRRLKRGR